MLPSGILILDNQINKNYLTDLESTSKNLGSRFFFFFLIKNLSFISNFFTFFSFYKILSFSQLIPLILTRFMIPKPILATFRILPSMNIPGRAQSLILVKENQVDTYTRFAVNAKEYNQFHPNMPGGRQIPECTQNHHRIIKREELLLTLYNATLFKLHLPTCFTPPRCSENIQQISKFPSQNIFLGPSSVSNHIFELVQISVTEI
jgi:hypothetical protein